MKVAFAITLALCAAAVNAETYLDWKERDFVTKVTDFGNLINNFNTVEEKTSANLTAWYPEIEHHIQIGADFIKLLTGQLAAQGPKFVNCISNFQNELDAIITDCWEGSDNCVAAAEATVAAQVQKVNELRAKALKESEVFGNIIKACRSANDIHCWDLKTKIVSSIGFLNEITYSTPKVNAAIKALDDAILEDEVCLDVWDRYADDAVLEVVGKITACAGSP